MKNSLLACLIILGIFMGAVSIVLHNQNITETQDEVESNSININGVKGISMGSVMEDNPNGDAGGTDTTQTTDTTPGMPLPP